MKDFFFKLLSDKGDVSMTRFISLCCVIISGIVAINGVVRCTNLEGVAMLVTAFLVPSLTVKAAQKFAEVKAEKE